MGRLPASYYTSLPVVDMAVDLLGKVLFTNIDGVVTAGIISETEAYSESERACHAYGGRKTKRTATLFEEGGIAYVYLCYGIHHLFNVVTGREGVGEAVLIRALHPVVGLEDMRLRRQRHVKVKKLTAGPGTLSQATGITTSLNGLSLSGSTIWLEDKGYKIAWKDVICGPRIGVAYAGEDALLPWRFRIHPKTLENLSWQ